MEVTQSIPSNLLTQTDFKTEGYSQVWRSMCVPGPMSVHVMGGYSRSVAWCCSKKSHVDARRLALGHDVDTVLTVRVTGCSRAAGVANCPLGFFIDVCMCMYWLGTGCGATRSSGGGGCIAAPIVYPRWFACTSWGLGLHCRTERA